MPDQPLTDAEIAGRMRAGARCQVCRGQRRLALQLCDEHRDELARVLDPDYLGDRDAELAASIPVLYARLNPIPQSTGSIGPRAPGFASQPPCDLHAVAMRDARSKGYPVVDVWYDPHPSGNGDDTSSPHYEDEHPPRPVESVVAGITAALWEEWGCYGPLTKADAGIRGGLGEQCGWLHGRVDEIAARDDAGELYRDLVALHDQLRPAAGDPKPKPVANCTGWTRDPTTREKVECGAQLFEPPPQPGVQSGPAQPPQADANRVVIRCPRCDRPYTLLMLLRQQVGEQLAQRRAC